MENKRKPQLVVMVGLQGSGKSFYAKENYKNYEILSSDTIREQILGDKEYDPNDNNKVFDRLYTLMQSNLLTSRDVVIDATNITRKSRKNMFDRIKNIDCEVTAIVMATPVDICITRKATREKKVPQEHIRRYYKSFEFPQKFEGFHNIEIISCFNYTESNNHFNTLENATRGYEQENPHHSLTLDVHMSKCNTYLYENLYEDLENFKQVNLRNLPLLFASGLHDIGKPLVQKWNSDKKCMSYHNHANVGTYELMICFEYLKQINNFDELLFYVNYHMLPYNFKKQETIERYENLFGERLFNNLMLLHEADKNAH